MTFRDRDDAGRRLAAQLKDEKFEDPVVLALPRGGVPVARHVASMLGAPLEVFVARKIGAPGQPELGIGAIAEGGDEVVVRSAAEQLGVRGAQMQRLVDDERSELARRVSAYRGDADLLPLESRDVIVVDDGLATGITAEAALRTLRDHGPRTLMLAVPVCPPETLRRLSRIADTVIAIETPADLGGISAYYQDFSQTTDDEVLDILDQFRTGAVSAHHRPGSPPAGPNPDQDPNRSNPSERTVAVDLDAGQQIHGDLVVPEHAGGIVLFAHGSGSSRHSPRNRWVAQSLHGYGFATMLIDLLTEAEEREDQTTGQLRFDVGLLAERLERAAGWLAGEPSTAQLPLGYFGASTGAAAALVAAARRPGHVDAVVSRGGRPDLAGEALGKVQAPTLLIVGGRDEHVLHLNQQAREQISGTCEVHVVNDASHLFEEAGALEEVSGVARDWFQKHLVSSASH
ncbi:phosphoribosyltransferase family protein [Phytoactinopolyspora mesophila]|uniref:Phosphoribosyltransferase n=1 Tax=Phytoactinopolyspora mesophila TaxID=2650750 RepID=A0A7K3LY01_9ACTN|nr:alpha/beta family hydrolase [Phytoactinopolyspora mesophila]NDL55860.1 phosphoribosyltransferase [Phytoactinopolyspora mesophila]